MITSNTPFKILSTISDENDIKLSKGFTKEGTNGMPQLKRGLSAAPVSKSLQANSSTARPPRKALGDLSSSQVNIRLTNQSHQEITTKSGLGGFPKHSVKPTVTELTKSSTRISVNVNVKQQVARKPISTVSLALNFAITV
jgi:hypothetical protein